METWQCRGSLESSLPCVQLPHSLCKCEKCPHLPGQSSDVFPPWHCQQLPHQSGVSHLSDFHVTHQEKSATLDSRGIFSPSLSKVPGDPHRKEVTIGFNSGSSSRSEPPPWDPSLPGGILWSADWLGVGSSANLT